MLVATDLDSGDSAPFGQPGLFPPVEIDRRHYVDGALKRTLHASVLLEEDVDLLFCLNPLVPFDASASGRHRVLAAGGRIPRLVDGGLPVVLSQTFRTMIHSRLQLGMKSYAQSHPSTTIVLFEPDQRDARMFLANTFSYAQRRLLAEHAHQQTRRMLRERHAELVPRLARHGVHVCARCSTTRRARWSARPGPRAGVPAARSPQPPNGPGKAHSKAAVVVR